MRFSASFVVCFAATTSLVAAKQWTKTEVTPNESLLLARQSFDSCTGLSCASCFGAGNIVCAGNSCFNPDAGEQCCSDGSKTPNITTITLPVLIHLPGRLLRWTGYQLLHERSWRDGRP